MKSPAEGLFGEKNGSAVFDKALKTITGKNAYEIERAEQDFKLLNPSSIQGALALAGMDSGVHQTVYRGDSVKHYLKKRFRYVDGNEYLFVKGTQLEQVQQDSTLTYLADRTIVVGKDDDISIKGSQTTFVLGPSSEQYVGKHEVTAPEEFEWKQLESGFTAMSVDMKLTDYAVTVASSEFNVLETAIECVKAFGEGLHEGAKAHEGKAIALRDEVIPFEGVLILRINGLIQVCTITPFG